MKRELTEGSLDTQNGQLRFYGFLFKKKDDENEEPYYRNVVHDKLIDDKTTNPDSKTKKNIQDPI